MIGVGQELMPIILVAFVFIYLIIKVIKNVLGRIPLVGKIIKKVALKIPPFPDFEHSGLEGLFDGIFGIVFSRAGIRQRFKNLAYAIGAFIEKNIKFSVQTTDEVLGITPKLNKLNSKLVSAEESSKKSLYNMSASINLTNGKGANFIKDTPDPDANDKNPILSDEQREIDDKYQQCLAENTIQIPPRDPNKPPMSDEDKKAEKKENDSIANQNTLARTRCKVNKIQTTISFMSNKYI